MGESEKGRWVGGRTVAVDGAVTAFGDVEEVRPFGEVGEVEVEAVGLGEGVEVGGVEVEDVEGVEGTDGGHFGGWIMLLCAWRVYVRRRENGLVGEEEERLE